MTERGVPIVDGATACPFVAFEADRDERSTRPDHRHRCYAEVRPASRALAHQEAFCLSTAFPACPTFQDWARREAARARPPTPSSRAPEPSDLPPTRPTHREWSAPPPWMDDAPTAMRHDARGSDAGPADAVHATPGPGEGRSDPGRSDPGRLGPGRADDPAGAPPFLAPRDQPSPTIRPSAGVGSDAASAGLAETLSGDRGFDEDEDGHDEDDYDDDGGRPSAFAKPPRRRGGRRPSVSETRRPARDLAGPSWERPHRYEAYPTLRTRVGLPNIPRIAVAFGGLILAALLLFLIPPLLLRPGGDSGAGGATPTPSSGEPTASLAPTPTPAPTPQLYTIAAGDTLSKVADKFGITLNDLLAANPGIKNPDKISIGQEIVIPVPVPSEVVDSGGLDGGSIEPSAAP